MMSEDLTLLPSQRMDIQKEIKQVGWWCFLLLMAYDFEIDKMDEIDKEYLTLHMQYISEHDVYH